MLNTELESINMSSSSPNKMVLEEVLEKSSERPSASHK